MSRQDVTDDVTASNAPQQGRRVIRRLGAEAAAENEQSASPPAASPPANSAPAETRTSVIRRIGPAKAEAAPPASSDPIITHPVIRRLLPAKPTPEEAVRRRALSRPLPPAYPRPLPSYESEPTHVEVETTRSDTVTCGQCGSRNRVEAMFCSTCGGALPAVRGLPQSFQNENDQLRQADHERELIIGQHRSSSRPVLWRAAGLTNPGKVRNNNEDTLLLESFPGNGWLMIVADGMGGAEAGEVASSVTATLVRELVETRIALDSSPSTSRRPWIAEAVEQANLLLYRHAEEDPALHGMGTTIVVAIVQGFTVELGFAGDSRCYLLHPDNRLEQLSVDHSIVAHLVRMGQIPPEEAEEHPLRSQLYRAVATAATIDVDTAIYELAPGSKLLLCSDGLPLHVTDEEIRSALARATYPEEVCNGLIALALARGGEDNVSVIALLPA